MPDTADAAKPSPEAQQPTTEEAFASLLSDDESPDSPEAADDAEQIDSETPAEEAEDSEAEGTEAPQERIYKVKVDGRLLEVPESELIAGYSRQRDYTQKTQKLAERERAFAPHEQAVMQERAMYAERLGQLSQMIQQSAPAEPDWEFLRQNDPISYSAEWASYQQRQQKLALVEMERQRAEEAVQRDYQVQVAQYLEQERSRMVEAIPSWKDPKIAAKEIEAMRSFAKDAGYSDDEINAVQDHRVMVLLRKAFLYDLAQKQKPALQQKLVAAAKPNSTLPPPNGGVREKAAKRLRASGSVKDAAAVFATLLDD